MDPKLPRLARDMMTTDVVTLDESESLDHLRQSMKALRFRHMPVVDGGRLVGMITERDLLRTSASSLIPHANKQDRFLHERFKVRDVMAETVETARPDTALSDIATRMRRGKLGCMPVVDRDNRLLGIITEADFVALAERMLSQGA